MDWTFIKLRTSKPDPLSRTTLKAIDYDESLAKAAAHAFTFLVAMIQDWKGRAAETDHAGNDPKSKPASIDMA